MRTYNRRFAAIARHRRGRGTFGRANSGQRFFLSGFTLDPSSGWPVLKALGAWLKLELTEGWRTWGRIERRSETSFTPADASPAPQPVQP
jgi:hypothetical protein